MNRRFWILVKDIGIEDYKKQIEKIQEMIETEPFNDQVIDYGYDIERDENNENQ